MKSDIELRDDVLAEIEWEPSVTGGQIGVVVSGGAVTLTGEVGSYLEKQEVIKAAKRISGVTAIADELEVAWVSEKNAATDTDVAQAVQRALAALVNVPRNAVQAVVDMGRVTLDGEVQQLSQRSGAQRAVESLRGVRAVSNLIRVVPAPLRDPKEIQSKIESAFQRHASVDASRIRVRLENGTVTLEGSVPTFFEREAAVNAASSAPGILEVVDHIQVNPLLD